jgi:transposase
MLMTRLSRCCCQVIRKRRPGGLWTYVREERNAGSELAPAVWFAYSPDRKGIHPQSHLAGFNELYRNGQITEASLLGSHPPQDP